VKHEARTLDVRAEVLRRELGERPNELVGRHVLVVVGQLQEYLFDAGT
jgi:hypothetical protein